MNTILSKGKTEGRNLKPEKSQEYAQKPQQNSTFMNSISGPKPYALSFFTMTCCWQGNFPHVSVTSDVGCLTKTKVDTLPRNPQQNCNPSQDP
jgi:hypothetical protein